MVGPGFEPGSLMSVWTGSAVAPLKSASGFIHYVGQARSGRESTFFEFTMQIGPDEFIRGMGWDSSRRDLVTGFASSKQCVMMSGTPTTDKFNVTYKVVHFNSYTTVEASPASFSWKEYKDPLFVSTLNILVTLF